MRRRPSLLQLGLVFVLALGMLLFAGCTQQKPAATTSGSDSVAQEGVSAQSTPSAQPSTQASVEKQDGVGIEVGDIAPDFELPLLDGGTVRLSDLRGTPVFINFMTTWCGPCQEEFPAVQQIYDEYGDRMQVLVISCGEPKADVEGSFSQRDYTFPIAFDTDDVLYGDYKIDFIPQSFFIDREGVIVEYLASGSVYEVFKTITEKLL
jgi:peroxiredoxin